MITHETVPMMAFCGNPLDRASDRRSDPAWLAAQRGHGLFLPFWQNKPFVTVGRAGFLPWRASWQDGISVFLGLDGTQPLFAVDVAGETEPSLEGGAFSEMRTSAFVLPARDTAIAGQAKALIDWHRPTCATAAIAAFARTVPRSIFPAPIRW